VDNQPPANRSQANTDATPTQPAPKGPANPLAAPENKQGGAQHNTKGNPLSEKPKWTDVAIVILTVGIVYFAFVQSRDTKDASKQTDRIIRADERLAKAMENSVAEAKATLDASVEISRDDQRAWVGATAIQIITLEPGKKILIRVPYVNSGRSAALNVRVRPTVSMSISPINVTEVAAHLHQPFQPGIILFPNFPVAKIGFVSPQPVSEPDLAAIRAGRLLMYIYGEIRYTDIFNRPHDTRFCGRYSPKGTSEANNVESCNEYNTAN
jgi:hypothetical protein